MICLVCPESRVPDEHPLREVEQLTDAALRRLSPVFDAMYGATGRPSVPPEQLLEGTLLMALYSVRSERQLCEQLEYNLRFRWFFDMDMLEDAFDPSAFVDGTLIEAWASRKSFRPKDEPAASNDNNGWADFRGRTCRNATHRSKTDPEARLMRKGHSQQAKLSFGAHALIENRNGLLVDLQISQATGYAEREVALEVAACRDQGVTPHVAQNQNARRRSAIDERTPRHVGYEISQRIRMRIEQVFGWTKVYGGLRKTRLRGVERTQTAAHLVGAAYNLIRIVNLRRCAN